MNTVKKLREASAYTQLELAEKAGLSLRTIQRLEASEKAPKGYSLSSLAKVFNVEPSVFQNEAGAANQEKVADKLSAKLINLSTLAFFLFPFGNIILPIMVWRKRNQSQYVDEAGRIIINCQIFWMIQLCVLLSISPFINYTLPFSFPLIFAFLFLGIAANLTMVGIIAHLIQEDNIQALKPPIRFL
ncbi:MAG: DUF4870 domain-containing protein [Bacteroidia bacterium]